MNIFVNFLQFSTVEVIITSLKDGFGDWIDRHIKRHEILVLLVCMLGFLFGIPHVFKVINYFITCTNYRKTNINQSFHAGWCLFLYFGGLLRGRHVFNVYCVFRMPRCGLDLWNQKNVC